MNSACKGCFQTCRFSPTLMKPPSHVPLFDRVSDTGGRIVLPLLSGFFTLSILIHCTLRKYMNFMMKPNWLGNCTSRVSCA